MYSRVNTHLGIIAHILFMRSSTAGGITVRPIHRRRMVQVAVVGSEPTVYS